jgi:hypothetical protein
VGAYGWSFVGSPGSIANIATRYLPEMEGGTAELWRGLCEQAAIENDPEKLMRLVEEFYSKIKNKSSKTSTRIQSAN